MIRYAVADSGQDLLFTDEVLTRFGENRQTPWRSHESGGQLFARFEGTDVIVAKATGPRRQDRRGRHFFHPNRLLEQLDIRRMYRQGLHFIGDWHTHPEAVPQPSGLDITSIADCYRRSHHDLAGFVLVVVGTAPFPGGLHVSLHSGVHTIALRCLLQPGS